MYLTLYVFVDLLLCLSIIGGIVASFILKLHWGIIVGLFVALIIYPLFTELWLNIWACLTSSESRYREQLKRRQTEMSKYSCIVYRKDFNLTACGLEKMHPFDGLKYRR